MHKQTYQLEQVMRYSEAPIPPLYQLSRWALRRHFDKHYDLVIEGQEHLPGDGAFIISPTHRSDKDPMLAGIAVEDRAMRMMAKEEMWTDIRRYKGLGQFTWFLGAFPVNRDNPSRKTVEKTRKILASGMILGMFAEGTRKCAESIGEIEMGVAHFAMQASCVVVPMGISSERISRGEKIGLVFGEALTPPARAKNAKTDFSEAVREGMQTVFNRANEIRQTK